MLKAFDTAGFHGVCDDTACESGKRMPTLLFLHGAGGRGTDLDKLKNNPFFRADCAWRNFPMIAFAPQCWADCWFDCFEALQRFADTVIRDPRVDPERVYLIGASMGGYGTWQLAMTHPDWFAAIAPICGGGMYWNAGRLKNTPVWAFHGALDHCVYPEESRKMVDHVNHCGGSAKLTVYPDKDHNSWDATYHTPALFEWMLTHSRPGAAVQRTEYNDSVRFG